MLKKQLIMMKTVKLLKRNHKNSVDELKVRDTSCPKGKKVEDIQYILEQVQDSSLAKVLVKFKFIVLKIQLNNPSKNRCYMEDNKPVAEDSNYN